MCHPHPRHTVNRIDCPKRQSTNSTSDKDLEGDGELRCFQVKVTTKVKITKIESNATCDHIKKDLENEVQTAINAGGLDPYFCTGSSTCTFRTFIEIITDDETLIFVLVGVSGGLLMFFFVIAKFCRCGGGTPGGLQKGVEIEFPIPSLPHDDEAFEIEQQIPLAGGDDNKFFDSFREDR